MDIKISKEEINRGKRKTWYIAGGVILGILVIFLIFRALITPTLESAHLKYAAAEIGDVEGTLNGSGTVVPEFEQILISPFQSKVLAVNHQAGENVQAGKSILKLDTEAAENEYNRLLDEYAVKKNKIEKQKLAITKSLNEMSTQKEITVLKLKSLIAKSERVKNLVAIGAESQTELERAELDVNISRKEQQLFEQQIENQGKSLEADLKEFDLELKMQERKINELKNKLKDAKIMSAGSGAVTYVKNEIGANVNAGDIVARIADLSNFKIEAVISEMYADKFSTANPVKVRINDKDYSGYIKSINPSVENRNVRFVVMLNDKKKPELRPNLKVEVFIIISNSPKVVRVKNGPFFSNSSDQYVFVVRDNKAYRVETEFGASNFDFVELKKGVNQGDKIIISNMQDYAHMKEIEIK